MSEQDRLEYLRSQIRAESISYGELIELQGLAESIDDGDVELLEWAGVPEFPPSEMHANLSTTGREPYHLTEGHAWTRACCVWACDPIERIIAHFSPQAWVNNWAIEVDPQGDQRWDATEAFDDLDDEYRLSLQEEMASHVNALDSSDVLKSDPNAPEWVREWQGPFSIYIHQENK